MTDTEEMAAKLLRAQTALEAEADRWLAEWKEYPVLVRDLGGMELNANVPPKVKANVKMRRRDLIDRLVRTAYMEGFYNGAMGRKDYDEASGK